MLEEVDLFAVGFFFLFILQRYNNYIGIFNNGKQIIPSTISAFMPNNSNINCLGFEDTHTNIVKNKRKPKLARK